MRKYTVIILFMLLTTLSMSMVSCGGEESPIEFRILNDSLWSTPDSDNDGSGGTGVQMSAVFIDLDNKYAVYAANYGNNKQVIALGVHLKHFVPGESLNLGADNLIMADENSMILANEDQATLFLFVFTGDVTSAENDSLKVDSAKVSVGGQLEFSKTSIRNNRQVIGTIKGLQMRPLDMSTYEIAQGSEIITYHKDILFSAAVKDGGTQDPYIVDVSPNHGGMGTEVVMRGFNLAGDGLSVGFAGNGCSNDFLKERLSDNDLQIVIEGVCDDTRLKVSNSEGHTYVTPDSFNLEY